MAQPPAAGTDGIIGTDYAMGICIGLEIRQLDHASKIPGAPSAFWCRNQYLGQPDRLGCRHPAGDERQRCACSVKFGCINARLGDGQRVRAQRTTLPDCSRCTDQQWSLPIRRAGFFDITWTTAAAFKAGWLTARLEEDAAKSAQKTSRALSRLSTLNRARSPLWSCLRADCVSASGSRGPTPRTVHSWCVIWASATATCEGFAACDWQSVRIRQGPAEFGTRAESKTSTRSLYREGDIPKCASDRTDSRSVGKVVQEYRLYDLQGTETRHAAR